MGQKILLVDDDPGICEILGFNLKSEGYQVLTAFSAEEGLTRLDDSVALILLDVMMGGMSGYKMAEHLRMKHNKVPIIFLTAKDNENDMLTGFSVGADDYISKPFSIKEVMARIKAVLQRSSNKQEEHKSSFSVEGLVVDFEAKIVKVDGQIVPLTKTEYSILELLMKNSNKIFSREEIIMRIWGTEIFVSERTVDVHIARLRKKMGEVGSLISNRPGFGYKFEG